MNIDVYDTYVRTDTGHLMHFDVLVPSGVQSDPIQFAHDWLDGLKITPQSINQENCRFCHTETATPEIARQIDAEGYFVLQMEGCPAPIGG